MRRGSFAKGINIYWWWICRVDKEKKTKEIAPQSLWNVTDVKTWIKSAIECHNNWDDLCEGCSARRYLFVEFANYFVWNDVLANLFCMPLILKHDLIALKYEFESYYEYCLSKKELQNIFRLMTMR
jgi:hypothetical protein